MATSQDNELVSQAINSTLHNACVANTFIETILLVGIREPKQIELIKDTLKGTPLPLLAYTIETCDFDEGLNPTIVHDLSGPDPIPAIYDLVICANTLMYVEHPARALKNLHHIARKYLILLEPIHRQRPDIPEKKKDGSGSYNDSNRFWSYDLLEKIKEEQPDFELQTDKHSVRVETNNITISWAYQNPTPDKIGGLWIFKE